MTRSHLLFGALSAALLITSGIGVAQAADPPAFNSDPGAPYTLYLNFGGFSFNGTWGGDVTDPTPGVTPAYTGTAAQMQSVWSQVAQEYAAYNVNVTTVDPAVAGLQAEDLPYTDANRQSYYDSSTQIMQTVIGGNGAWTNPDEPDKVGGGISYVGVAATAQTGGMHTNFVFAGQDGGGLQFISQATAHEDGHAFGLNHQSDYTPINPGPSALVNEYSAGTGTGNGSVAPVMGDSYTAQRGLWSIGTVDSTSGKGAPTIQNDAKVIVNNPNMNGFFKDGIGQSLHDTSTLPINGNQINSKFATGVIVPLNAANPGDSYTTDFWSFHTSGGAVTLNELSGISTITPGVADPGATLSATMILYNASDLVVGQTSAGILSQTLALNLPAGDYVVEIASQGGVTDNNADYNNRQFFDVGSYFLTGSIPVPEPGTIVLAAFAGLGLLLRAGRRHD